MSRFFNNVFSPRSTATKTDDLFADWDLLSFELLLEHFDVKDQAIERGENNYPISSAATPDEFHASLTLRYQKLIASDAEMTDNAQNIVGKTPLKIFVG